MINVSPEEKCPTHHVSLTDGEVEVGLIVTNVNGDATPTAMSASANPRTALKTTSGNTKWSDLEPPWTAIAQESWEGGRGQEDEDDPTKFFDSRRLNTTFGSIMLSPLETYTAGYGRIQDYNLPGSVRWISMLTGSRKYMAVSFEASDSYTAKYIYLHVRRRGTPAGALNVALYSDVTGAPGVELEAATITTTNITDIEAEFYRITLTGIALTSGTTYWLMIHTTIADEENYWQVGVDNAAGTTEKSSDGTTWEADSVNLYYRITNEDAPPARDRFFRYKQQIFVVRSDDSGAPKIYMNGDIGAADANTGELDKLIDATKSWATDRWVGCIAVIIGGTGAQETQNWRKITANNATTLTVDGDWVVTHATDTEYIIINSDYWKEVGGHGLTAPVTDVLLSDNFIYFAQGDGVNIRRGQWRNAAGTAEWRWADDGTNKAEKMSTVYDATDGFVIWKSNTVDAGADKSVAVAPAATSWVDLVFETAIKLRDDNGKINNMIEYGDVKQPWLFREGTIFTIANDKPNEIPLKEIKATMSSMNGMAVLVHNIYLYFNIGHGLERYYDGDLLDMGLNRDAGLPADRQGIVNNMIGYPGRFFASVDGGDDNYSSLYCYNMLGWHELYRAPVKGHRILGGAFQTIYGDDPDKLWISVGQDLIWLAFPSNTIDPAKDPNVMFHHEGSLISSWQYDNLFDVAKLWNSLKVFVDGVTDDGIQVEVDYQVDDDTSWTTIDGVIDETPMKELMFSEESVNGKRIRYRLRLMSNDNTKTPKIKTTVIEGVSKVPVKYSFAFSVRATDQRKNLLGQAEDITSDELYAILDGWARSITKLKMHSIYRRFDDINVFIDPPQYNPFTEHEESYLDRLTVTVL